MSKAGIVGIGSCLPENIITNYDLENKIDTSNDWIISRTGIKERRIVNDDTTASDLATIAAQKALKNANIKAEEIDLVIVATLTPDMVIPATACIVQDNIGASKAGAFDLEAGCSGFIYGLATGAQFINSKSAKNVLVIGSEVLSKFVDWTDRNTCILFGDGAGAVILSEVNDGGIINNYLRSDGSGKMDLYIPAGGSKLVSSENTVYNKMHYIKMNGNDVFKFAVQALTDSSIGALEKTEYTVDNIDLLVPHQANIRIVERASKKLGLKKENVFTNIHKYGNMSSASIPVALEEAINEKKIVKDNLVLLVGFGAGLTWGGVLVKWSY